MYENVLEIFIKRRSIRSYQDKCVEKEKLDTILKAAFAAPSTCNNQPWEMIVVTEKVSWMRLEQNSAVQIIYSARE